MVGQRTLNFSKVEMQDLELKIVMYNDRIVETKQEAYTLKITPLRL